MAGAVHIPWYATGFRGDQLQEALEEISAVSLRYGASHYAVYRSMDDRYRLLQILHFENKADWQAFWDGPEFTRFRVVTSGWWQVPVLYVWQDIAAWGHGPNGTQEAALTPAPEPSPAEA